MLAVLELAHRVIAIGALIAIAVHSIIMSDDIAVRIAVGFALALALAHLVLAFRLRMGQKRRPAAPHALHPYRSLARPS